MNKTQNRRIIIVLFILLFNMHYAFSETENIDEILENLSVYNSIAGPIVGAGAQKSQQWKLYEQLKQIASIPILLDSFHNSESIVVKIYIYWVLREIGYVSVPDIEDKLLTENGEETIEFLPYGCFIDYKMVKDIISFRLERHLENRDNQLEYLEIIDSFDGLDLDLGLDLDFLDDN